MWRSLLDAHKNTFSDLCSHPNCITRFASFSPPLSSSLTCRYEVNPQKVEHFAPRGLHFTGHDTEGERMEILELDDHPFFFGVQYHPEFMSRPMRCVVITLGITIGSACPFLGAWVPPPCCPVFLWGCLQCGVRRHAPCGARPCCGK